MPLAKLAHNLPSALEVDYLLVAGGSDGAFGGSGDPGSSNGGTGGQVVTATAQPLAVGSFPVVVGGVGGNSSFNGVTAAAGFLAGGAGDTNGHNGSNGTSSSFSGTPYMYGSSGGGGGADNGASGGGAGGIGAGSGGGDSGSGPQVGGNATNYGCGGGGGCAGSGAGGAGVQGLVLIRYLGSVARATGGVITTGGGYTLHTFTASGTFTRV